MVTRAKILIVEDEVMLAKELARGLKKSGYEVVGRVSTGEEAVQKAEETLPDLILMDITLEGGMDGIETSSQIQAVLETAIIYLTAHTNTDVFGRAKITEPYAYLTKPISHQELVRTVEIALYKREMDKKLRRSEHRFRELVENLNDIVFSTTSNGILSYVSPPVERVLGYTPVELVGQSYQSLVHPEDLPKIHSSFQDVLNNRLNPSELRILSKSGEYRWIRASSRPIFDGDKVVGINGVATDITSSKKAEEALAHSEQELRLILEATTEGIWKWNFKSNRLEFSPRYYTMLGYEPDEFPATYGNWLDLLHPEDHASVLQVVEQYLETKPDLYENEFRLRSKSGDYRWIRAKGRVVERDLRGDAVLMIGNHEDITDQKKAEAELRKSEVRYRTLFERARDAIIILDLEGDNVGRIVAANPVAEELHGYGPGELRGIHVSDLDTPESAASIPKRVDLILKGEWVREETMHRRKDGSVFPVEIRASLVEIGGHKYALAIDRDITDRKMAEESLAGTIDELERTNREIQALLEASKGVLHEKEFSSAARTVFDECCKATGATSGYVALLNENGSENEVLFLESGGLPCSVDPSLAMPIRGLLGEAYREGRVVYDNDFSESLWMEFMPEGHVNLESVLFAPLRINGKTVGLLCLANKPGGFDDRDVRLAGAFGELTALGLSRTRAIESLARSEERFRLAMEATNDGLWDWNVAKGDVYRNPAFYEIWGYRPEEFPRGVQSWKSFVHPEDAEGVTTAFNHCLSGTTASFEEEFRILDKSGEPKWVLSRGRVVEKDKYGNPQRVVGTDTDITERKRHSKMLEAMNMAHRGFLDEVDSHQLFDSLLQSVLRITGSEYGYIGEVFDAPGDGRYQLSRAISNLAWTPEIQKYYQENWRDGLRFTVNETLQGRVIATGKPVISNDPKNDPRSKGIPEGHPPITTFMGLPIYKGSTLVGTLGVANRPGGYNQQLVDFMEPFLSTCASIIDAYKNEARRKEAEEALRESEELHRATISNISDAIFLTDDKGAFTYVCPNTFEIFGYLPEEVNAMGNIERLLGSDLCEPEDLKARGEVQNIQHTISNKSGEDRILLITVKMVAIRSGTILYTCRDITERAKAEQTLRKSEEKFSRTFHHAPVMMTLSTIDDGTYLEVNDEFCRVSGFSREEAVGNTSIDLGWISPSDRRGLVEGLLDRGHISDMDIDLIAKDKRVVHAVYHALVLETDRRQVLLSIAHDTTDRKRAEEDLRASEERYRVLFENSADGIVVSDQAGSIVSANQVAADMHGYAIDEFLKLHIDDLCLGTEEPLTEGCIDSNLVEHLHVKKDGNLFTTQVSAGHIETASHTYALRTVRDISAQKNALEELENQRDLLSVVFENAPYLMLIVNENGRVQEINRAGEVFSGKPKEELLGLLGGDIFECIHSFDGMGCGKNPICRFCPIRSRVTHTMETGEPTFDEEAQFTVKRDSGSDTLSLLISTSRIKVQGTDKVLLTIADITEKRKAEKERESLMSQLLQAQKMESIGNLSGGIAHDFNNLLQVILGYSDMLIESKKEGDLERDLLIPIKEAAMDGAELVKGLLTFSRRVETNMRPLNINQLLQRLRKMLRRLIPRMIQIEFSLEEAIRPIQADTTQIEQMLLNLAVNAHHAMNEQGRLTFETSNISLDTKSLFRQHDMEPGPYVLLTVSDTGEGMTEGVKERIFEPFFTTKETNQGTGLGLSIVYGVVKSHGGNIMCESALGQGTTFKIFFPAIAINTEPKHVLVRESPQAGTETILLVDDERRLREFVGKILSHSGYQVLTASNGKEALEVYRREKDSIDMVLLDLVMPVMGGKECLSELVKLDPNVKVLVTSGQLDAQRELTERDQLARGVLAKPFTANGLLVRVRKVIDENWAEQEPS
jgi:PAS domain S-box-containing protein